MIGPREHFAQYKVGARRIETPSTVSIDKTRADGRKFCDCLVAEGTGRTATGETPNWHSAKANLPASRDRRARRRAGGRAVLGIRRSGERQETGWTERAKRPLPSIGTGAMAEAPGPRAHSRLASTHRTARRTRGSSGARIRGLE